MLHGQERPSHMLGLDVSEAVHVHREQVRVRSLRDDDDEEWRDIRDFKLVNGVKGLGKGFGLS